MGNRFEFTAISSSQESGDAAIVNAIAEVQRIETLFSTFKETSQVNEINRLAGVRPVEVDEEVIELIVRSLKISSITQGAFDITYGSIDKRLWNFDRTMQQLPDTDTARKMIRLINYRNVLLDDFHNST
ncbi:MAG: FAD:protein FMN transferase [Pedobacter sp.]|nr:MAG: FAD:protein FMN transferase [Pedobacter sp.]